MKSYKNLKWKVTILSPLDSWECTVTLKDWLDYDCCCDEWLIKHAQWTQALGAAQKAGLTIEDLTSTGITMKFPEDCDDGNNYITLFLFKESNNGTTYLVEPYES